MRIIRAATFHIEHSGHLNIFSLFTFPDRSFMHNEACFSAIAQFRSDFCKFLPAVPGGKAQ